MSAAIYRDGERLTDSRGNLVGWIAPDEGKFHPCGATLTADQLRAIQAMLNSTGSAA